MRLYHFTSTANLHGIMADGAIRPDMARWDNLKAVHLSTSDDPLTVPTIIPTDVCIEVEIPASDPDVHLSTDWLREKWGYVGVERLNTSGGGNPDCWYAITRPIKKAEWKGITKDGQPLTNWRDLGA